jgi:predicted nuclease with TOPRIM domain
MMSINLKREFLSLLEKDVEFRYAVAGYLGLSEILKKMDALIEEQHKLWEEIKSLRENQNRLWEEVRELRKDFRELRRDFGRLEERVDGLRRGMKSLADAVGTTLDYYTAAFVEDLLRGMGVPDEKISVRVNITLLYSGKFREVDIFNRDPLVVGEVTTRIESFDRANEEINKVVEDVNFVEAMFGEKVFLAILAVEVVSEELTGYIEEEAKKRNIRLVYGRSIPKL